jgi:cation diffusion facilitator CzcD-associated flavoprotein CzcO
VTRVRVAVVGSGFAGLAMAAKLREAGIHDFVILERAPELGGTWRDNHYPGCACDVPSHLYSFSFAPNPDWSSAFAPQREIRAYIERVAAERGLRRHVRFGAELQSAELEEADATWTLRARDGRTWIAEVLVMATGGLSRPAVPDLPGLSRFEGNTWHSAAWRHDVPLVGKTVAVVGTGASAIQFVPQIAPEVARLHVFQRTPPWIWPRPDHDFGALEKQLLRLAPLRWLYRQRLFWAHEARAVPFALEPRLLRVASRIALANLHRHVADPELRRKLTPDYVMGCKRVLLSNDYYPALTRPNVEVVTDVIREVSRDGVVTAQGVERRVDAIIFGTGFDVQNPVGPVRVRGRDALDLEERWRAGPEAYLGTSVPGFPNLFTLVGPNTGLGHNSMLVMIEAQVRYVMSCLDFMRTGRLASVEVRPEVCARYNEAIQARLRRAVWSTGCKSWYLDARGKNTTLWPGPAAEFVLRTLRFDRASYVARRREVMPAPEAAPRLRVVAAGAR